MGQSVSLQARQITTHRCYVGEATNGAVSMNKDRRGDDIRQAPQYQKRCTRVLARMRFIERRICDSSRNSRELANVSASIDAQGVQGI